jgi:4-amino-4-deoxy-L-arabinose transferase-like glycosyltransferase
MTKLDRISLAALGLVLLGSLPWLVHPWYVASHETNDAAMYVLAAKSMLAGEGYAYLGKPFTVRPPGMSAVIAPVIGLRGPDFGAMHLFVHLFGIAAILGLFVWIRPRVGSLVAASLGIALWLNPTFRRLSNEVMSDVPGLALLIALFFVERWADRKPSSKRELALGAAIGLASYMRTILLLFLPAIAIARAWRNLAERRQPWRALVARRIAPAVLGAVLVCLPWSLRNAAATPKGAVDQFFVHSYGVAMFHMDSADPDSPVLSSSQVVARIRWNLRELGALLGSCLSQRNGGALTLSIGALLAVACAVVGWKRKESSAVCVFLFALALLVYFRGGFLERLALASVVLGAAAAAEIACATSWSPSTAGVRRAVVAGGLLALAVLDFPGHEGWAELERAHRARVEQARIWNERLPADARLASAFGWNHSIFLGKPVYTLGVAILRDPDRGIEKVIDEYGLNTVILGAEPADTALLPYFEERYSPGLPAGEGWIFRVRP